MIALNGHLEKQFPQEMHFLGSMVVCPSSSLWIAPVGHASSQGTVVLTIAWNGQTETHFPHLMHLL